MDISVVIPTLNGLHNLKECIPALQQSLKRFKAEIIIVDNNSHDGTKDWVKDNKLNYIHFKKNKGFTGATNAGAAKAKGKYLLFLNNDCIVNEETINQMYSFLGNHTEYIATQPVIYNTDHKTIEQIGFVVDLAVAKAQVVTNPEAFKTLALPYPIGSKEFHFEDGFIYGLSGTCLFIQRSIFLKEGMFDESFHSYLEDVELAIRLSKKGYNYFPTLEASCTHEHMATTKKLGAYKERQDLANWIRIILNHYPPLYTFKHYQDLIIERLRNASGLIKKIRALSQ